MGEILTNAVGGLIANEASAIIKLVVKRIIHEINLGRHLIGGLEKLGDELETLASLVPDACEKASTNKVLYSWLTKVENIAYNAEDLLDEWCYVEVEKEVHTKRSKRSKVWYAVTYPILRQKAAHKVKALLESMQELYNVALKLGISVVRVAGGEVYDAYASSSRQERLRLMDQRRFVEQEFVYGREQDFARIIEMLQNASTCHHKLNVVGIVGMGGLGKTTLSNKVSKSKEVKTLFDKVISVIVSFDCGSTNAIMEKIAIKVLGNIGENDEITSNLQDKLGGAKYLLTLDDVWHTISWSELSNALLQIQGSEGTTILVTSREKQVVKSMNRHGKPSIHTLHGLSEPDSWSLFTKRINNENLVVTEQYEIAKRMIKNCGGIPLAINLLGDLLRNNNDVEKWREFEKSKEWTTNDASNIFPSLRLSYIHLSSPILKSCFSYCAIFGEDELIYKGQLIRLWMAQGLLPKRTYAEMDVVGEEYFNELLNSSLFHEPNFDNFGNVENVKMHDLVRELACRISKRNNEEEAICNSNNGSDSRVRHVSISMIEGILHFTKLLRTCLIENSISSLKILKDYTKLRALSFTINFDSKSNIKDWEPLGNLKHLRYLEIISLKNEKLMVHLLPQIAKLYHLQTLILFSSPPNFVFPKNHDNLVSLNGLNFAKLYHLQTYTWDRISNVKKIYISPCPTLRRYDLLELHEEWIEKLCILIERLGLTCSVRVKFCVEHKKNCIYFTRIKYVKVVPFTYFYC